MQIVTQIIMDICAYFICRLLYRDNTSQDKCLQTDSVCVEDREVQTIYEKGFLNAKLENMLLKNEIKLSGNKPIFSSDKITTPQLSLNSIKDEDAKMKLFTGLYYDQFIALYEFLGDSVHNLKY